MSNSIHYTLGIDIGSTTVKIAILDEAHHILFSDYKRHFANIQETLSDLLKDSLSRLGNITLHPMITGSGGLTLANHLGVPFVQEVISVSTALQELAPPPLLSTSTYRAPTPSSSWAARMPRSSILKTGMWNSV